MKPRGRPARRRAAAAAAVAAAAARRRPVKVPEIDGAGQDAYAQKVADAGLAPKVKREFRTRPKGTLLRVEPKPGTEVEAGST